MERCLGLNPSSVCKDMALLGTETVGWESFLFITLWEFVSKSGIVIHQ